MRAGLRFYQVQAQVSATRDGWGSSRQVRTMIVGASDPLNAATEVSHVAWDMSTGGYVDKTTHATVIEVINGDNGDITPIGELTHVKVEYRNGSIYAHSASTYAELAKL
jgi:hypothetical protein